MAHQRYNEGRIWGVRCCCLGARYATYTLYKYIESYNEMVYKFVGLVMQSTHLLFAR